MSRHTTFGVGGPADLYLTVRDSESLKQAARTAREAGEDVFVLGSGSNILVSDLGIRGLVIDNRARAEKPDGEGLEWLVESGASFAAFARRMGRQGRDGLTWAVGIPGTLGGAVVYNAGAYGGCLADVLTRVRLDGDDIDDQWLDAPELGLVYRGSVFTRGQFAGKTVLEVEMRLSPGDPAALRLPLSHAAATPARCSRTPQPARPGSSSTPSASAASVEGTRRSARNTATSS
jgi:UDP-N-acetylmuramate dehydrogenase